MQAAARRGAAAAAASFHSTAAAALSKSTPRIRFNVREKRADAKSALKNILLNGGSFQERSNKQTRQQKAGGNSKVSSGPGNSPHSKGRRVPDWRNFDDDDSSDSPYGSFGGKASFTWYWPGDDDELGSTPSGFQWREEPRSTKSRERIWNESDVDEEDESCRDDLKSHRTSLGLPASGPLKLDHIKSAFRASALKWHPDKHQGSSQTDAEEKFRRCVEAYNTLAGAFKSTAK
uniref:Uncharacterized protein n=1 Tax=Avena sativa TaxID=4498 RepID=A0ACD5U049_AVESA